MYLTANCAGAPDTDETRLSVAQSYLHRIAAASRKSQNYCNVSADALPFDQVLDPQDDSVSVDYERNENSDDELFLDVEAKGTASQYLKDRLNPNVSSILISAISFNGSHCNDEYFSTNCEGTSLNV